MNISLSTRLIAFIIAAGVTVALFTAVVSPAMQQQADGSVRLAHSAVGALSATTQVLVAQASVIQAR
jgi:hypothetical protein